MLKDWQKYRWLWLLTEGTQVPVADTASYTLDPRPYEVVSARFQQSGREIPMTALEREEYFDLPIKTVQGIPTQYYYDRQRDEGTLYIWPVLASVSTETITYTYRRIVEDVTNLNQNLDVRQEYLDLIAYNLAARYADKAGKPADRVVARAESMLAEAMDDDRPATVRMVPSGRQ